MSEKKIYSPTAEEAVLALDNAFSSRDVSKVLSTLHGKSDAYEIVVLKTHIERMGLDVFQRDQNVFIEKKSSEGFDSKTIRISREAIMLDDVKCREEFLVKSTGKGWQVVKRENIELKRQHPVYGEMHYDGYGWKMCLYVPWLNSNIAISLDADRIVDERGPSKNQLEVVKKITERKKSITHEISEKTFSYIKELFQNWLGEDWEDISDKELAELNDFTFMKPSNPIEALQTIIPPYSIIVSEEVDPDKSVWFIFNVENKCDREHGLSFLIEDWEIREYGSQGSF